MIRRPPRSTQSRSSAASDVYKRQAQNIPFQVVPGITAASGCASYAGIPLTHRDHAQSCTFVTGHLKDGSINLDWPSLTGNDQTIVCYMGLLGLPIICKQLIAHGKEPDTPAALIERGTTSKQQVHTGTISNLPAVIATKKVTAPTPVSYTHLTLPTIYSV